MGRMFRVSVACWAHRPDVVEGGFDGGDDRSPRRKGPFTPLPFSLPFRSQTQTQSRGQIEGCWLSYLFVRATIVSASYPSQTARQTPPPPTLSMEGCLSSLSSLSACLARQARSARDSHMWLVGLSACLLGVLRLGRRRGCISSSVWGVANLPSFREPRQIRAAASGAGPAAEAARHARHAKRGIWLRLGFVCTGH